MDRVFAAIAATVVTALAMYFFVVLPMKVPVSMARAATAACELSIEQAKLSEKKVEAAVAAQTEKVTTEYRTRVVEIPKYVNVPQNSCDGAKQTLVDMLKGEK
jgi:hypothetical protein